MLLSLPLIRPIKYDIIKPQGHVLKIGKKVMMIIIIFNGIHNKDKGNVKSAPSQRFENSGRETMFFVGSGLSELS